MNNAIETLLLSLRNIEYIELLKKSELTSILELYGKNTKEINNIKKFGVEKYKKFPTAKAPDFKDVGPFDNDAEKLAEIKK